VLRSAVLATRTGALERLELPTCLAAIEAWQAIAIWFGITTGYFTIAGGHYHIPPQVPGGVSGLSHESGPPPERSISPLTCGVSRPWTGPPLPAHAVRPASADCARCLMPARRLATNQVGTSQPTRQKGA
jgi:hypothetical protein